MSVVAGAGLVTLFVDVVSREIRYAVAGHPRQLIIRRSAGVMDGLPQNGWKPGPALCVFPDQRYDTHHGSLVPGDLVLLFTDGLFEVEAADGELFDQERLLAVVRNQMHLPPAELQGAIIHDIKQFACAGNFNDDVCLVIMDFEEPATDHNAGHHGFTGDLEHKHPDPGGEHDGHRHHHDHAAEEGTGVLLHNAGIAGHH